MQTFRCACCHGNFEIEHSELEVEFMIVNDQLVTVCEGCYKEILAFEGAEV